LRRASWIASPIGVPDWRLLLHVLEPLVEAVPIEIRVTLAVNDALEGQIPPMLASARGVTLGRR
jgi:hypothetical protein